MDNKKLKSIRILLIVFIVGLFLSGLSAIPISNELKYLEGVSQTHTFIHEWIIRVQAAYQFVEGKHPFLLYGYDWLAFAHFILAILFIGAYRNPIRNIWVIEFGIIACFLVFPFALIAGYSREIPIGWRLLDCSFGIGGLFVLIPCYLKTKNLIETVSLAKQLR